jgi:hypothetical protein
LGDHDQEKDNDVHHDVLEILSSSGHPIYRTSADAEHRPYSRLRFKTTSPVYPAPALLTVPVLSPEI